METCNYMRSRVQQPRKGSFMQIEEIKDVPHKKIGITRKISSVVLASVLILPTAIGANAMISYDTAEGITLEEAAAKVEETSAAYSEAVAIQEDLAANIESLTTQIADLEAQMPELERKAGAVCRAMYMSGDPDLELLNIILGARSVSEAIRLADTYDKLLSYQTDQLDALTTAKTDLETSKVQLETDKVAADEAVAAAKEALDEATAARQQAQAEARAAQAGALAQQIDWSMPKDEFVAHWAARINNYLAGTNLAGQGENFADAAYQYGTDPRWSPAISRIESGCGAACFRPYNAWGWMGSSFSSWSEGIYKHVKYLSGPLYGGYLTPKGAATYCPPGGPWYSKVSAEMSKI